MTETAVIESIGQRGDGVYAAPDGPVFVPFALPGERVLLERVPGQADRRSLREVEVASADRVAPICPHFGTCGGCALQHWTFDRYAEWKRSLVETALSQVGLDVPIDPLIDAHGAGRRRVVLHARRGAVGFAAPRAHDIVPIDQCPVLAPALDGALRAARALADVLASIGKPLDIQITATDTGLDVDLRGSGALSPSVSSRLVRVAAAHRLARLTRHGDLIAQSVPPTLRMGRATVVLPPGGFLQATAEGEETLARLAGERVGRAKHILDLFCGVGPFALRLAERARVWAMDSDAPAIAALKHAVANITGVKPVRAEVRDLFRRPLLAAELKGVDAVVFDPPRQGAEALARSLASSSVPTIVGISCNPATFARDARLLVDGGYKLVSVVPVDQFRYSNHVELVAHFAR